MGFKQKLEIHWKQGKFVCVGLDPDYSKLPESLKGKSVEDTIFEFNKAIIDATFDLVCVYKPQSAYYELYGAEGLSALKKTVEYINQKYPDILTILDAKRGDIGPTNEAYAKWIFEEFNFDAVTLNPYLGKEALLPFLNFKDKGCIILVRTSNPGAGEFQDLLIDGKPLYQIVAQNVAQSWNTNGNCAVVVGATYPKELEEVRAIVGDMPILIPGVGAQGGDVEATVKAGKDSRGWGIIISSSRGIIYADSPREACKKLSDEIQSYL